MAFTDVVYTLETVLLVVVDLPMKRCALRRLSMARERRRRGALS